MHHIGTHAPRSRSFSSRVCSASSSRARDAGTAHWMTGIKLAGERAGLATFAGQHGFEVIDRTQQYLLDDLAHDRLGGKPEALLAGKG